MDSDWDIMVFGSVSVFGSLNTDSRFQNLSIDLLLVHDEDSFAKPWGDKSKSGSLSGWQWKQISKTEVTYRATKSVVNENGEEEFNVEVTERKAILIFPCY